MSIPIYYQQVYEIVEQIPPGRVTSYGAIADFLSLGSARMVGYALKNSGKIGQEIPAHRVVNSQGMLSGRNFFNPPELMQILLLSEGVPVENNKVVHFKRYFIYPRDFKS